MSVYQDHEIQEVINELRAVAEKYGQTKQLRERIASIIIPLLKQLHDEPEEEDLTCPRCKEEMWEEVTIYCPHCGNGA